MIADPLKKATFASGLAHLLVACVELDRASSELNEVNDWALKTPDAPLSLKEWHAIFKAHKRLLATYRRLNARYQKGAR
jgi:hypothetical protein